MATKEAKANVMEVAENLDEQLTMVSENKDDSWKGPTVRIMLPEPMNSGDGSKVDMYEHVTLANEQKEKIYYVRRGEWVDVPVPVFLALKETYPKI